MNRIQDIVARLTRNWKSSRLSDTKQHNSDTELCRFGQGDYSVSLWGSVSSGQDTESSSHNKA